MLFLAPVFSGEMSIPRTVKVISTQYFDILFCSQNEKTAVLLSQQADELYLKAKRTFDCNHDFRTIVVISPDSDTLSVQYTASPYNRIVIFDAVGRIDTGSYSNGLLDLFYHEIGRAVSQSVRSSTMNFVADKLLGDSFQPIGLLNVPWSFLEGAVYAGDEKSVSALLQDNWNLQLLVQAKLEGKFPSLLQISGAYDIYPVNRMDSIATAAFYAYVQQKWGIQKFGEYWQESGKLNFFKLDTGIFYMVYGQQLKDAWQEFIDIIPLPGQSFENEKSGLFLPVDYDSNYKFIVSTNYGLVWYDELKEEVDISVFYDYQKNRQLLFLANSVTNLTVSPCGRFLVISHVQGGIREKFEQDVVRIYDLKKRRFLSQKYSMRDGAIVILENGHYAVAGNDVSDGFSSLVIYECQELNELLGKTDSVSQLVYTRSFADGITPYNIVALSQNNFASLLCKNNDWYILLSNIQGDGEEKIFTLARKQETLKIRNLRYADYAEVSGKRTDRGSKYCLLFDFVLQNSLSFVRTGWIFLDAKCVPYQTLITATDFYGGMGSGAMFNCNLYYASQKYDYSQLRFVNLNDIPLEDADIYYTDTSFTKRYSRQDSFTAMEQSFTKYSPFKYLRKGSFEFFMPVRSITLEEGLKIEPGLGVVFQSQSDPFDNTHFLISAAKGFIPLDFTTLFNASKKEEQELKAKKIELSKDATFAVQFVNTSTPADITLASVFKFNKAGEYTFNALSDIQFSLPLAMTFRRLVFNFSGEFISSTTYWDTTQTQQYPNLSHWPKFKDSYRRWQAVAAVSYSNIHQYGVSPLKKLGVAAGTKINSFWSWGEWNPFQINAGLYATAEIPFLMPLQNYKGIILSLPSTIHAELFYNNGKAVEAYAQVLFFGMEIQNGFWRLYFPRVALYGGYDIALEYDTATVHLPDLRHPDRFYEVFGHCYLNDSFYCILDFGLTPVIGKFSKYKLESSLRFEKFLRSKEFKLKFDIQITN
ncbi:MAG: hypothetical protein J5726_04030 [Treponema sp.]|nr:hypothetical protein [Treponema sp.]